MQPFDRDHVSEIRYLSTDKPGEDNMKSAASRLGLLTILTAVLVVFTAISAYGDFEETWDKTFEVKPGGLLTLESDLGSVEVKTHSNNTVGVEVLVRVDTRSREKAAEILDDIRVDFEQDGNDVSVYLEYKKPRWFFGKRDARRLQVDFFISVPREYNLDLRTRGGSIRVDDLEGDIHAKTSGGSLHFEQVHGSIQAKTSGGSIKVGNCSGMVDVMTSGGSIKIGEVKGEVVAHTSGGSIKVEEVMGMIDASTSGGSITARIAGQPGDDCRLTTSGGSVNVYLNRDIKVNLDAKTSGGHVEIDFPVSISGRVKKSSLQGEVNGGGPELYLRTSGGNINLRGI